MNQRLFMVINGATSFLALAFLFWLIYFRQGGGDGQSFAFLPAVNASLNATTAAFLIRGWFAIKGGNRRLHAFCMKTAFIFSALFLACYIVYHSAHGDTPFPGQGLIRPVYFFILISHIVLSMAVLPMILGTFFHALTGRLETHKKWARLTLPIWLYVSLTGVMIFFLLKAHT
jgi:putative membrane protein